MNLHGLKAGTLGVALVACVGRLAVALEAPDLTETCWRFELIPTDMHPFLARRLTPAEFEQHKQLPPARRIVCFADGRPGRWARATLLSPPLRTDFKCDRLTITNYKLTTRTHYGGEYPGQHRWLYTKEPPPRVVDGSCEPNRRGCMYLWLEARPLASSEKKDPPTWPKNYSFLNQTERDAVGREMLRQKYTGDHVPNDRMELEVQFTSKGTEITGRALDMFAYSNVKATRLQYVEAQSEASSMEKLPAPRCGGVSAGGGTSDDPEDPYGDLRKSFPTMKAPKQ